MTGFIMKRRAPDGNNNPDVIVERRDAKTALAVSSKSLVGERRMREILSGLANGEPGVVLRIGLVTTPVVGDCSDHRFWRVSAR